MSPHTWRVPEDLTGEFTAEVQYEVEGFEIETEPTTFIIE